MLEYRPGWGCRDCGGHYGAGAGISTTTSSTIYIAALAFDTFDAAGNKLIWRRLVSKPLDTEAKSEKRQKNLDKRVAKRFKSSPPNVNT